MQRTCSAGRRLTSLVEDVVELLVENVETACVYVVGCRIGND